MNLLQSAFALAVLAFALVIVVQVPTWTRVTDSLYIVFVVGFFADILWIFVLLGRL